MSRPVLALTHSAGECYRACPRRYLHRYVQLLRRVGEYSEALDLGTLVHSGLESIWRGEIIKPMPIDRDAGLVASAAVAGYVARWGQPSDVEAVEQVFSVPVAGLRSVKQEGKIDALRRVDGRLQLVEHKTAGKVDGGYLEKLWSDSQITGYCRAVSLATGEPCRSVLYDVVLKPTFKRGEDESNERYLARLTMAYTHGKVAGRAVRPRKDESDEAYLARVATDGEDWDGYLREELIITDADIARWEEDFRDLAEQVRWSTRTGRWPHYTKSCFDWGRACDYLPICRAGSVEMSGVEYEVASEAHGELNV